MSSPSSHEVTANNLSAPDENRTPVAPVVRKLKPPPEIWELVQPVTIEKSESGRPFGSRRASSWMILVFLAFVVGVLGGTGTALWKNPAAKAFLSSFQKQNQAKEQKPTVTDTAATPPQATVPTAAVTESPGVAAAPTPPTSPTSPTSDATTNETPIAAETTPEPSLTDAQTQLTPGPKTTRTTSRRTSTQAPTTPTTDDAIGTRVGSNATSNSPRPAASDPGKGPQRTSTETAPAKPKSIPAENSQVLTPVKQPSPSKAKVIQWP